MNELLKFCGFAVITLTACIVLRETGRQWSEILCIALALAATVRAAGAVSDCVTFLKSAAEGSGADKYVPTLLKAGCIAFITDFTSQLCRSAGEGNIGGYVELAGRSELILLALPLVGELLELSFGLLAV